MKLIQWLRIAVIGTAACLSSVANATDYTMTAINVAGATDTAAYGVNNHGQVVGNSFDSSGVQHAFVFSAGTTTMLSGPSGSLGSGAFGISDDGVVVGSYADASTTRGFIYEGGIYQDFYIPGSFATVVRGISSNGRYIAGSYGKDGIYQNAFVLDRLTNDLRLVQTNALLHGVNNSGVAAGGSFAGDQNPFIYDFMSGTISWQPQPYTRYRGINNHADITGAALDAGLVGFHGKPGSFESLPLLAGYDDMLPEGINDAGWIVGVVTNYQGDVPVSSGFIAIPTAVPEPSTYLLLALGLTALGLRSRRR